MQLSGEPFRLDVYVAFPRVDTGRSPRKDLIFYAQGPSAEFDPLSAKVSPSSFAVRFPSWCGVCPAS